MISALMFAFFLMEDNIEYNYVYISQKGNMQRKPHLFLPGTD